MGLVRQVAKEKLLQGVKIGKTKLEVIVFHDDIVFTRESNHQNEFTIETILRCFELVSRFRVNFHK